MKKFFQFACVAAIAAGFVACGNGANSAENADSVLVEETVVVDSITVDSMAVDTTAADSAVVVK